MGPPPPVSPLFLTQCQGSKGGSFQKNFMNILIITEEEETSNLLEDGEEGFFMRLIFKINLTKSYNPFIIKTYKHYIMKSYKKLFTENGFTFNGKQYGDRRFN
jgi:hypothetical protein